MRFLYFFIYLFFLYFLFFSHFLYLFFFVFSFVIRPAGSGYKVTDATGAYTYLFNLCDDYTSMIISSLYLSIISFSSYSFFFFFSPFFLRYFKSTHSAAQTQTYCYAKAPVYQMTVTNLCYLLGVLPPVITDGSEYFFHFLSSANAFHCSKWTRYRSYC